LPHLSGSYADGERTFNTASFGLPLPGFDPNGQIIGPVRTVDMRGRVVANLIDPASFGRYRSAQAAAAGASADAAVVTSQAASIARSFAQRCRRLKQLGVRSVPRAPSVCPHSASSATTARRATRTLTFSTHTRTVFK